VGISQRQRSCDSVMAHIASVDEASESADDGSIHQHAMAFESGYRIATRAAGVARAGVIKASYMN